VSVQNEEDLIMRENRYGVRGLKGVQLRREFVYFWTPPVSLQKARIFRYKTLGTDLTIAIDKAREWNDKLDAYRSPTRYQKPQLANIKPMSVGYLLREFAASPRFARYVPRTRKDYSDLYRNVETSVVDGERVFGELLISEVTRRVAYGVYEQYALAHGHGSANKMVSALRSAFNYATLKIIDIAINPFWRLDTMTLPARRQRWTEEQLTAFIGRSEEMGCSSIGRCALICFELVQRPGDVLSMKWGAYEENYKTWLIRQSKRGTVVRVPETERLRTALAAARQSAKKKSSEPIDDLFVCPTATGKRWNRRNFTRIVRRIATAAGLPGDLQVRDLRRTGATEGASAGATPAELMAVGGWTNQASIRPYLVQTMEQAAAFQAKRDAYRRKAKV
jgi:integrase